MPRRRRIILWLLAPYLVLPAMGLFIMDSMACARKNAALSMAADEAAHAGLHALQQGVRRDDDVAAAVRRHAIKKLGDTEGVAISTRIAEDRRSVAVSIHRPGRLCWSQVVGLAKNQDALAVAALPPPGQRPTGRCPLAWFIPC